MSELSTRSPFQQETHPSPSYNTEPIAEAQAYSDAQEAQQLKTPPSVEELQRQKEELDRQIAERQKAEKTAVIQQILDVAHQYQISVEDLVEAMGGFKPKRKGVKATAKYRDPSTGITWSGRGKEPTWLRGQDRDKFLIQED